MLNDYKKVLFTLILWFICGLGYKSNTKLAKWYSIDRRLHKRSEQSKRIFWNVSMMAIWRHSEVLEGWDMISTYYVSNRSRRTEISHRNIAPTIIISSSLTDLSFVNYLSAVDVDWLNMDRNKYLYSQFPNFQIFDNFYYWASNY